MLDLALLVDLYYNGCDVMYIRIVHTLRVDYRVSVLRHLECPY